MKWLQNGADYISTIERARMTKNEAANCCLLMNNKFLCKLRPQCCSDWQVAVELIVQQVSTSTLQKLNLTYDCRVLGSLVADARLLAEGMQKLCKSDANCTS